MATMSVQYIPNMKLLHTTRLYSGELRRIENEEGGREGGREENRKGGGKLNGCTADKGT